MISEAIKRYHSLLTGALADDAIEKLLDGAAHRGLEFGGRPICSVLRPLLISESQYEYIKKESTLVISAIDKLGKALMADSTLRSELQLSPEEEQIITIEPGYASPDASGRLDAFLDSRGDFSFVEYNADSPGGLLYGDVLSELFMGMEVVREFAKGRPLRRIPIRPKLLNSLLGCFRQWSGASLSERPNIAIVDWREVQTRAEFEICREYFESRGCRTVIVDPEELDYRGGWLRAGDFQIDLVYKRVVIGELLARGGLNHPLIRAARERAVCVANSFRVQMLYKKALFALLDDEENEHLFTPNEVAALRRHIPWTRILREEMTAYRNRKIDLVDFVSSNQERLALKPNGEYGGRGVKLGWECSSDEWRQAIDSALGASFVVQERVVVLQETFPTLAEGEIRFEERFVDLDPYSWNGEEIEGAGVRLSPSPLLNVTAGGGSATPMLIVQS